MNRLLKILITLTTGFAIVFPLGSPTLLYLFRIPALIVIMCIIICLVYHSFFIIGKDLLMLLLVISSICLNFLQEPIPININTIIPIVSILLFLLLIIISDKMILGKNVKKHIYVCTLLTSIVYILYSFSPVAHQDSDHHFSMYLILGLDNPNLTGIILFLLMSTIMITRAVLQHKFLRLLTALIAGMLNILIFETNSRMALCAAIIVFLLSLSPKNIKISKFFRILCCSIPFIFPPLYMFYERHYDAVEFMGKSTMSGRTDVYLEHLNTLTSTDKIMFGNLLQNMFSNAHNAPLAILCSIGVVGSVGFWLIVLRKFLSIRTVSQTSILSVIVLLSCFIHSSAEAALFLGGFPCITYMFIFFVLAFQHDNE